MPSIILDYEYIMNLILVGMNLAAKLLHHIIMHTKDDKSLKLSQFFKSFKVVFEDEHWGYEYTINGLKPKYKYCSLFKMKDGKRAVEKAIRLTDSQSLNEILKIEKVCHPNSSRESIRCFRDVTRTDGRTTEISALLDQMYDKSIVGRYVIPLMSILPLLLRLASIVYDEISDARLAMEYHSLSSSSAQGRFAIDFNQSCISQAQQSSLIYHSGINNACQDELPIHENEYNFAKWYIAFSVLIMLLLNGVLTRTAVKKILSIPDDKCVRFSLLIDVFCMTLGAIASPLLIIWEIIKLIILKWKITVEETGENKSKLLEKFWNSQLKFGMFEAIEATEASAQLLLQVWMAATKFGCHYGEGFWPIVRRALLGIFFVFKPTSSTSTEDKTLGKIMISFISIVISAFSMYRRTKREAVDTLRSPSLMISILSQIFVHIVCLLPLYFAERHPLGLLLPIAIHYILISFLKFFLDPSFYLAIGSNKMIALLNIVGSLIINVNLTPVDGYDQRKQKKSVYLNEETQLEESEQQMLHDLESNDGVEIDTAQSAVHHTPSTFFLQSLFFLIKVIENFVVYQIAIHSCHIWDGIRLFEHLELNIGGILLGGSFVTWLSHSFYYRFYGHPWSYSNGPSLGKWFLEYQIHFMGDTKTIGKNKQQEKIQSETKDDSTQLLAGIV